MIQYLRNRWRFRHLASWACLLFLVVPLGCGDGGAAPPDPNAEAASKKAIIELNAKASVKQGAVGKSIKGRIGSEPAPPP